MTYPYFWFTQAHVLFDYVTSNTKIKSQIINNFFVIRLCNEIITCAPILSDSVTIIEGKIGRWIEVTRRRESRRKHRPENLNKTRKY